MIQISTLFFFNKDSVNYYEASTVNDVLLPTKEEKTPEDLPESESTSEISSATLD